MTKDEYKQTLRGAVEDVRHLLARKMAEALSSKCEAIMLGALRSDGNTVTRATERGIEPVQPRELWVDPLQARSMDDQEFRRVRAEDARRREISWYGALWAYRHVDPLWAEVDPATVTHDYNPGQSYNPGQNGKPSRELRYLQLRGNEQQPLRKLGEINAILEAEGYSEVSGEGVMPCPTKSHEIVRENKGAKQLIKEMP